MSRHPRSAWLAVCALALVVCGSVRADEVDASATPGSVDGGSVDLRAGAGRGKPPSGVAPLSSVGIELNTGGVTDLFLADDKSSAAGANSAPESTAIISMLLVACAQNDPISANREVGPFVALESAKTGADLGLGRPAELRRQIRNSIR